MGSCKDGRHIPELSRDEAGNATFDFHEFDKSLLQYFKPLPGILSYSHFEIDVSRPGVVLAKKDLSDDPTKFNLLKNPSVAPVPSVWQMPSKMEVKGLNAQRQWYLYDSIREHVKGEIERDITTPRPTVAKSAPKTKEEKEAVQLAKKRARGDA